MEHLVLTLLEQRRGRRIVAVLAILLGGLFTFIAWPDVRDARRLKRSRAFTDAEVVAADNSGTLSSPEYRVRYRFRVEGRDDWLTRGEPGTVRTDLWSTLPKDEWERAKATGRVRVVYLPEDPRVNRAASAESSAAGDSTGGLALGLILMVGGALWLGWMIGRDMLMPPPAVPSGDGQELADRTLHRS